MATGIVRARSASKDYIDAFARLMGTFTATRIEELLSQIPAQLVAEFDAARAELWLWDDSSHSAYLVHSAGVEAERRHDYATSGDGAIGKVGEARKIIENIVLSTFGGEDQEFAKRSGLFHITAYPLTTADKTVAVLAVYSQEAVNAELLNWWRMYSEMCAAKVPDLINAREQQKQITQLSLLFEATRLLNSTLDLAELLELILKIANQEVRADRGSVFLVDAGAKQLWSIVASGLDHQEIRIPFGKGVAGRVAESGEIINVEDARKLPYFESSFDQKFGYKTKSLLSLPIRHHSGEIVGVIQLLNKKDAATFSVEDEDFLSKLSGHMAMALENARLHRDALIKQRLEKELALARGIQRSLLPDAPPIVPGYEIAVLNEPCFEVGGDYYDFLSLGPQSLLLVIADVEGKGVGSALVMSNLQATLRALVMHLHSLEVLAVSLNEMMCNDTKSEKYLSCFLGLVDTRRGGLHYINAGHVPPMVIRAQTGTFELLEEGGTVVGLFPAMEYRRGSVKLEPGDVLVCCTDGILEACNAAEDEFGKERLADCVVRNRQRNAQGIVDAVLSEVNTFSASGKYTDDKVLMIMKVADDGTMNSGKIIMPKARETERRSEARD
ncbi:MAG TPA: GAF domain-containing SpoIIE family protein phosphatase [Terriglobales bacterium]|nr:GAF domain-containing SpoIIE family protein phosphatase [Terriglobales bacterium]